MTYIDSLYLNPDGTIDDSALYDWWDENYPDWESLSVDPESRSLISESDVENPGLGFVRRYGSDDPGRYFPGVDGE